jgi:hypothetical protein
MAYDDDEAAEDAGWVNGYNRSVRITFWQMMGRVITFPIRLLSKITHCCRGR